MSAAFMNGLAKKYVNLKQLDWKTWASMPVGQFANVCWKRTKYPTILRKCTVASVKNQVWKHHYWETFLKSSVCIFTVHQGENLDYSKHSKIVRLAQQVNNLTSHIKKACFLSFMSLEQVFALNRPKEGINTSNLQPLQRKQTKC